MIPPVGQWIECVCGHCRIYTSRFYVEAKCPECGSTEFIVLGKRESAGLGF